MITQKELRISTQGRGTYDLSRQVQDVVAASGMDPAVMQDLETFMSQLVPDGDPMFTHTDEGPDDMPAHVRSILTQSALNLPVVDGLCALGTWQGIFLWEHRYAAHTRKILLTISGE